MVIFAKLKKYLKNNFPKTKNLINHYIIYFKYLNMNEKEMFKKIYISGAWGKGINNLPFNSGIGSSDKTTINAYIDSLKLFFISQMGVYNVVDCGCGDFNIGSQIRSIFNNYTACDIVDELISFNKIKFNNLNVDFKNLNLINDEIPKADIIIFRQVLQHLSNENILKIVSKINNKYKYLIISEHLPSSYNFVPNINKINGPGIRLNKNSGVILSEPPFNLNYTEKFVISDIAQDEGRIETIIYRIF